MTSKSVLIDIKYFSYCFYAIAKCMAYFYDGGELQSFFEEKYHHSCGMLRCDGRKRVKQKDLLIE